MKLKDLRKVPVMIFSNGSCVWNGTVEKYTEAEKVLEQGVEVVEIYLKKDVA